MVKCPRCGAKPKHWRLMEDSFLKGTDTRPDPDADWDSSTHESGPCRSFQCPQCFVCCSQRLCIGALATCYPVRITKTNLTEYYDWY